MSEAAVRYGVPTRKINRLVYENQLDGARKVRGAHGMEWRLPAAELEARGFHRQEEPTDEVPDEVAELRRTVRGLTDLLVVERRRWSDKQRELEEALLAVGDMRGQLRREQRRREQAETKVAELVQRLAAAETVVDLRSAKERDQQPSAVVKS